MVSQISAVINTLNEEKNIKRLIESLRWVSEIVVVDDGSEDKTLEILNKLKSENANLKVFKHKSAGFVEPARNFAISQTSNEWILILDADEQIPPSLRDKLREIVSEKKEIGYVRLPRKNLIFGYPMQASSWWPDYNIRFFRKGKVTWIDKIHRPPKTQGEGIDLAADEKWAIVHNHYSTIAQFLERMTRYTKVQADELIEQGYKFDWKDLITKPLGEFLGRFFANRGFEDGVHGLALSLLQSFSFLIVYLRIWEMEKFQSKPLDLTELKQVSKQSGSEIEYWFINVNSSNNIFKRFFQKLKKREN